MRFSVFQLLTVKSFAGLGCMSRCSPSMLRCQLITSRSQGFSPEATSITAYTLRTLAVAVSIVCFEQECSSRTSKLSSLYSRFNPGCQPSCEKKAPRLEGVFLLVPSTSQLIHSTKVRYWWAFIDVFWPLCLGSEKSTYTNTSTELWNYPNPNPCLKDHHVPLGYYWFA